MLTSVTVLITNESISKLKTRYTKRRDWINVITRLYEKTSIYVDKFYGRLKIDRKEAEHIKTIYNRYPDKRKENMENTQIKAEDISGDVISKDSISPEQITKFKNFLAKMM